MEGESDPSLHGVLSGNGGSGWHPHTHTVYGYFITDPTVTSVLGRVMNF